ncbi:Uncharacterised protein [uncultured archaeon]|nr:Uncharacterised protein [uncultured archaeon]
MQQNFKARGCRSPRTTQPRPRNTTIMNFYSYLWLREDGTPYYAGKGFGRRAFKSCGHRVYRPREDSRIVVFPMDSEALAFESEIALIELFGRLDLGTGCLRNLTNGGDGTSGYRPTEAHRRNVSLTHKLSGLRPPSPLGRVPSLETRMKVSLANKGRKRPDVVESNKRRTGEKRNGIQR